MTSSTSPFNLLNYLASSSQQSQADEENGNRIPSLNDLSLEFGISVASLREQLGVARALGLVEVRPKTGIRSLPYNFTSAVSQSLNYAIQCDRKYFEDFSDLRRHLETQYWTEAVERLTGEDKQALQEIVHQAWQELKGNPIRVPHRQHRDLHLLIFSRLDNAFVTGILEAYWEAYEEVGLNTFNDLKYLKSVWSFHSQIVEQINNGEIEKSFQTMLEHMDLIEHRENI